MGVLRNNVGFHLLDFLGYIYNSSYILQVELLAIYQGLLLAKTLKTNELICYSNSLHNINLIKGPSMKYHVYALLIHDKRFYRIKQYHYLSHPL